MLGKELTEGWRFDSFELDRTRYELRRFGAPVSLPRQPMELLILLLERRGALVTREEITDRLWGRNFSAETDRSINTSVSKIRRALRDDADQPNYVETVVGKGYRFVANVEAVESPVSSPVSGTFSSNGLADFQELQVKPEAGPIPQRTILNRLLPWRAPAIVLASFGLAYLLLRPVLPVHERSPVQPKSLTSGFGVDIHPRLSADGQKVVFSGNDTAGRHIYIKAVSGSDTQQLTHGNGDDISPVWSTDAQLVAFFRTFDARHGRLVIVPAAGGPEHFVGDTLTVRFDDTFAAPIDWSPDGQWFVVSGAHNDSDFARLMLVSSETGSVRDLTSPEGGPDLSPRFSLDGRKIVFIRSAVLGMGRIHVLHLTPSMQAQGSPIPLAAPADLNRDPAWTPDQREIIYSAGVADTASLYRVRSDGSGAPARLPFIEPGAALPDLQAGPARKWRISYMRRQHSSQLLGRYLDPPHLRFPVHSSAAVDNAPKFSPDGSKIAFRSTRSGSWELWLDSGGHDPIQLTQFGGAQVGGCDWSPDGKQLVFDVLLRKGFFAIARLDLAHNSTSMLIEGPSHDQMPKWSRDGRWIYFRSTRSGNDQIWKMRAAGGDALQITRNGGEGPLGESTDGRYLYYYLIAGGSGTVRRISLDASGDGVEILRGVPSHGSAVVRDRGLYYFAWGRDDEAALYFSSFTTPGTREIIRMEGIMGYGIDVSPDEKRFVYANEVFRTNLAFADFDARR